MDRRTFVKTGAIAATAAVTLNGRTQPPQKTRKPNILYVFGDQHRAFSLAGETSYEAMAPAMDGFRRQNFSMDTCVSNYPLCSPYRAMLMTGQYPTKNGVYYNSIPLTPKEPTIAETFQKNGYHTGYVGKWHIAGHGEDPGFIPKGPRRMGFEDWRVWNSTNLHYHAWTYNQETGEKISPEGWQPVAMTDEAIDFIKAQPKDKPWMLMVSWNPPHPPYNPPPEELAKYPVDTLKLRPNVQYRPKGQETENGAPHYLLSENVLKEAIQGYYGAITGIDKQFARLLKTLEDTGQAENTIVIYTSDHGEMMGSHGRMQKQVPYEESCRVPFMVRYPGVTPRGKSDALFAAIDKYPTLCGLAGIPVPAHCSGRDHSPVMRSESFVPSAEMVFLMNQVEGRTAGPKHWIVEPLLRLGTD